MSNEEVEVNEFKGIYKELAEIMGVEKTLLFHKHFRGMQITFPIKLYSMDAVMKRIESEYDGNNLRALSLKYEYSERWIRKQLSNIKNATE